MYKIEAVISRNNTTNGIWLCNQYSHATVPIRVRQELQLLIDQYINNQLPIGILLDCPEANSLLLCYLRKEIPIGIAIDYLEEHPEQIKTDKDTQKEIIKQLRIKYQQMEVE